MLHAYVTPTRDGVGRLVSSFHVWGVFFLWRNTPIGPGSSHYRGFTIALRHTTLAGLLWTSDQIDAESFLPDSTQHPQETDMHTVGPEES
jgi:hypothetical protein